MFLTKGGITIEVDHPTEIARLKALGYTQEPEPKPEKAGTKPEKAVKDGA
jgi:hypothetical protein